MNTLNLWIFLYHFYYISNLFTPKLAQNPAKYDSSGRKETDKTLEQTTAVVIRRGMRGMSSMGKPVSVRPTSESNSVLLSNTAKVSSALLSTPPVNEFTCACATGWSGPTCEISKYPFPFVTQLKWSLWMAFDQFAKFLNAQDLTKWFCSCENKFNYEGTKKNRKSHFRIPNFNNEEKKSFKDKKKNYVNVHTNGIGGS